MLPLGVPQLIVTGDADTVVDPRMSRRYAAAARLAGDEVELLVLPGVVHGGYQPDDAHAFRQVSRRVLAAMDG